MYTDHIVLVTEEDTRKSSVRKTTNIGLDEFPPQKHASHTALSRGKKLARGNQASYLLGPK